MHRLIGRDHEMGELRGALARSLAGARTTCLISGEPGIGKTTLARALSSEARAQGALVAWGRVWEGGGAPPLWPWTESLRSMMGTVSRPAFIQAAGNGVGHVARILPELATDGSSPEEEGSESEEARFRLFDAVAATIDGLARVTPLVIVLDDLHAAEPGTVLLARFLARRSNDVPLLVVGTYRDVEAAQRPEISSLLADLTREGMGLRLHGLPREDVASLLGPILERIPSGPLVDAVYDATQGNPLFVQGVGRGLKSHPDADLATLEHLDIPIDISDALRRRLNQLSETALSILSAAAVLGRDFEAPLVRVVADEEPSVIDEALQQATSVEVLAPSMEAQRSFTHALYREVLYREIPRPRRNTLHARAADAFEERHSDNIAPYLSVIAFHLLAAESAVHPSRTFRYLCDAGDHAMSRYSFEEALARYRQATSLAPTAGVTEDESLELALKLGRSELRAGETDAGSKTLEEAAAIAKRQGRWRELALISLEQAPDRPPIGDESRYVALLDDAIEAVGDRDELLRARLLARHAVQSSYLPAEEKRDAHARESLDIARRAGDPEVLGEALLANLEVIPPDSDLPDRLKELADEALQLARSTSDLELEMRARLWKMHALLHAADRGGWERERAEYKRVAQRVGVPLWQWYAAMLECTEAALEGRIAESERLESEALRLGFEARRPEAMLLYGSIFSARTLWGGDYSIILMMKDPYRSIREANPDWIPFRVAWAFLLAVEGDAEVARDELRSLASSDFAEVRHDRNVMGTLTVIAETALFVEDSESAPLLYDRLLPYQDMIGVTARGLALFLPIAQTLGGLAALIGRPEEAERLFEKAESLAQQLASPPLVANARYWHAWGLARTGEPHDIARAQALLETAINSYRTLEMTGALQRAQKLLDELRAVGRLRSVPLFRKDGEYWTVDYLGDAATVKATKGTGYLAELILHAGRELHVLQLAGREGRGEPGASPQPLLDEHAKQQIGARIRSLHDEIDDAESFGDPERVARAQEELDELSREVASALGLGGRDRTFSSASEKARLNVTRAIRSAIDRIERVHPTLGAHLTSTIRTGTFCIYEPLAEGIRASHDRARRDAT